jgi:hypothetical protein
VGFRNTSKRTHGGRKAGLLTLQPGDHSRGWTEKSVGGRQTRRVVDLITMDLNCLLTPITSTSSHGHGTKLVAAPLDAGLQFVVIDLEHMTQSID